MPFTPLPFARPPLSEGTLKALEAQLGVRLPEDYREFLLVSNGGVPNPRSFLVDIGGEMEAPMVGEFISIDEHLAQPAAELPPGPGVTLAFMLHKEGDMMPPDTLPIGEVDEHDILLLYIKGPRRGQVHMLNWDEIFEGPADKVEWPRPVEEVEAATHFVANSFKEFYDSLAPGDTLLD